MMNIHGMGSLSSPIVISDDEDEACVELELEQRLSSPREGMELDFDVDIQNSYTWGGSVAQHNLYHDEQRMDDYLRGVAPNGRMPVHGTNGGTATGQKRKRDGVSVSPKQHRESLPSFLPRSFSPDAPPGESKRARKKRRRKELLDARSATQQSVAAAQQAFAMAGSSRTLDAFLPTDIPNLSSITQLSPVSPSFPTLPFHLHSSLPPKPMMHQDYPMLMPPLPLPNMHMSLPPMQMMFPLLPPPLPLAPMFPDFPPQTSQPELPVPQTVSAPLIVPPVPEPPRKIAAPKKPIGMAPDVDPSSHHGTYTSPSPTFPAPNPARTLVMELLPKKFRTQAFVRGWAAKFGTALHRVDLNIKFGKALIEFTTADQARTAWESDRLMGEGKEHIRLWWYRVPGIGADAGVGELEEGEIEDGEGEAAGKGLSKSTRKADAKARRLKSKTDNDVPDPPPLYGGGKAGKWSAPSEYVSAHIHVSPTASSSTLSSPVELTPSVHHPPSLPVSLPRKPTSLPHQPTVLPSQPEVVPKVAFPEVVLEKAVVIPHSGPPTTAPSSSRNSVLQATAPPFIPHSGLSTTASSYSILQATASPFIPKSQASSAAAIATVSTTPPRPEQDAMDETPDIPLVQAVLEQDSTYLQVPEPSSHRRISVVPVAQDNGLPPDDDVHSISSSRPASPVSTVCAMAVDTTALSASTTSSTYQIPISVPVLSLDIQSPAPRPAQSPVDVRGGPAATMLSTTSSRLGAGAHPAAAPTIHSTLSTPTPPPSEPRATRNAPKVPSFAKRKEVEEKMAKHREEKAARSSCSSSGSATPVSEIEAMIVDVPSTSSKESSPASRTPAAVDLIAAVKEDDLRRLVLNSRRSRNASAAASPSVTTPSTPAVEPQSAFGASVEVSEVKVSQHTVNLDELAVSFISQSIQAATFPSSVPQSSESPTLVSPIFSEKALLSAKQKILEWNIADQKELMVQYTTARTKADRDRLKKAMAERSRAMEQEMEALTARVQAGKEAARTLKFKWPETDKSSYILVISDDEDEE